MRRRLREKAAVQRPAGSLFFRRCQRRAAERHAGSTPRVGSSTADRALRSCGKHPGSCAPHKARRSSPPQNSSTHILLSNPIARPLPLLYPRTFVLLPRAAQESGASRHSETLSWFGGLGKVKSSRSSASRRINAVCFCFMVIIVLLLVCARLRLVLKLVTIKARYYTSFFNDKDLSSHCI